MPYQLFTGITVPAGGTYPGRTPHAVLRGAGLLATGNDHLSQRLQNLGDKYAGALEVPKTLHAPANRAEATKRQGEIFFPDSEPESVSTGAAPSTYALPRKLLREIKLGEKGQKPREVWWRNG